MDESQTAPAPPSVENDLTPKVDKLLEKVTLLQELFVKRIKDDQVQQGAFNAVYQELQQYKSEAVKNSQKPLLKGLVLIYDAALRMIEGKEPGPATQPVETVAEEIIELLHRHDVEVMTEQLEKFDNKIQLALRTEPAASEEEHQRIAQVVRQGFRWGSQVLRPQEVVVKIFKKG